MNKSTLTLLTSLLLAPLAELHAAATPHIAEAFTLVKEGRPASCIVLNRNAGVVEKHAASELSTYIGKISGGVAVPLVNEPSPDLYNIRLGTLSDQAIAARVAVADAAALTDEGFILSASKDGLVILGKKPVGVLYGVYELLQRYAGIRWLTPGEDGEYYTPKPTIAVPAQSTVHNPSLRWRKIYFIVSNVNSHLADTWDWMVRNKMQPTKNPIRPTPASDDFLDQRGAGGFGLCSFSAALGGFCAGRTSKEANDCLAQMLKEHPDRCPLVQGNRLLLSMAERCQPCTTNPDVMRISRENIDLLLSKMSPGDQFMLFNDDSTVWCQCADCIKVDPPREKELRFLGTRHWTFINQVLGPLLKKYPQLDLGSCAYQNFQEAPSGVIPEKGLTVMRVYNRRCYRHNLDDPQCPVNRVFVEYFQGWARMGNPGYAWEEIWNSCGMPIERVFINQLKLYKSLGMNGSMLAFPPVDGTYSKATASRKDSWYGIWMTFYLAAQFEWNLDSDYDRLHEEAGSLYYGKAWAGGMRELRALMVKTLAETPGCLGWGHSAIQGRLLTQPGAHQKLLALFAQAEKAASGDPRAAAHVKRDRESFARHWEETNQRYRENDRELRAFQRSEPIRIDGVLSEPDWRNADVVTNFKRSTKDPALQQTYARIVYEPDFIYFGIEAMEPEPARIASGVTEKDGPLWEDNTLEIFLTYPDREGDYYHLSFNSKGLLYDAFNRKSQKTADRSFDSKAEIVTRVLNDRWVAEVKIPAAPLGMQCLDGHVWRINVGRGRILKAGSSGEYSSLAGGVFHDVDSYPSVSFAGKREFRPGDFVEKDTRLWKNGRFNDVFKRDAKTPAGCRLGENELLPRDWNVDGSSSLEMVAAWENDYYLKLRGGKLFQFHSGKEKNFSISFRACGQGEASLAIFTYPRLADTDQIDQEKQKRDGVRTQVIGTIKVDSPAWKNFRFKFSKEVGGSIVALAFLHKSGEVSLDDVFMFSSDAARTSNGVIPTGQRKMNDASKANEGQP